MIIYLGTWKKNFRNAKSGKNTISSNINIFLLSSMFNPSVLRVAAFTLPPFIWIIFSLPFNFTVPDPIIFGSKGN